MEEASVYIIVFADDAKADFSTGKLQYIEPVIGGLFKEYDEALQAMDNMYESIYTSGIALIIDIPTGLSINPNLLEDPDINQIRALYKLNERGQYIKADPAISLLGGIK